LKKTAVVFALTVLIVGIFMPFSFNFQVARAQTAGYTITHVDHNVQVLYSGHVVISDKIQISGSLPSNLQLGFPYRYGSYVLKGIAYDSNFKDLPVMLGVQLQDQSGFYGASVNLPQGTSNTFTVVFVLSNGALTPSASQYSLDFPAYPSFTQTVAECSVNLTLPSGASIIGIDKTDGVVNATTYAKANLAAFTYSPATATFSAASGTISEVNIPSLIRQFVISPSGGISCKDTYQIVNNSTMGVYSFLVNLPVNATNVVARDQFGRALSTAVQQTNSQVFVENVTLAVTMGAGESNLLILDYSLPSVPAGQFSRYALNLDLFPYFNYFIETASVTVTPPEGATIVAPKLSQIGPSDSLNRNAFQESLTVNMDGVSYLNSIIPSQETLSVTFEYSPLWIAFRPTLWAFAVVLVGVVIVGLWKRPKGKTPKAVVEVPSKARTPEGITLEVSLSPEKLSEFVAAYEDKNKIASEIRSLEARAAHGRIPRRRYKVQRRTLELRLENLNRTISQLKEPIRSAGGSIADIVRQIENAEIELNEAEMNLKNIDIRHETGEISLEAYRKQHPDLERRKEKAEEKLEGLLLRLRGEIS
jgi:hypothetical protein